MYGTLLLTTSLPEEEGRNGGKREKDKERENTKIERKSAGPNVAEVREKW